MTGAPGTMLRIPTRGPFSLTELGTFGFGHNHLDAWDGVWRLAFVLDGFERQVGVEVRQTAPEELTITVAGGPLTAAESAKVAAQVARMASCDHDGNAFHALGRRDPVLGRLIAAAPGLRPPLFASPYEGALFAVLTQRRSRQQASALRRRLGAAHGATFALAGRPVVAVPTPEQLLTVAGVPGLPEVVMDRLHGVARAALEGRLDVDRIAASGPEEAKADLRRIPGIGPFSAELVVVRASGLADVLAFEEPRARSAIAALHGLPDPLPDAEYRAIAERWRPFRTWALVLARAVGSQVLGARGAA